MICGTWYGVLHPATETLARRVSLFHDAEGRHWHLGLLVDPSVEDPIALQHIAAVVDGLRGLGAHCGQEFKGRDVLNFPVIAP
jgi:hypothetical protein